LAFELLQHSQQALRVLGEEDFKTVLGPLHAVDGLFGEQLEGAHGDVVLFLGVLDLSVVLSLVGQDHLDMALGSESA
jgi:hypothetical protein